MISRATTLSPMPENDPAACQEATQVLLGQSRADVTQIYAEMHEEIGIQVIRQFG